MHTTRQPAVAGAFYSGNKQILTDEIKTLLASATAVIGHAYPKAIIVPHAGYIYSGQTAAIAYARLTQGRESIKRVVLLGPVHRVPVRGLALPDVDAFATPLGEISVDQEAIASLAGLSQVVVSRAAHGQEHSLEVQLPFLQTVLDDFKLVPLAVGDATPTEVAEVLNLLWGGPETVIVVSSDLSHYLPYKLAQSVDQETVQNILGMHGSLTHQQACGGTPVNGLILAASRHHLKPKLLDLCNSGDTAGDKDKVVGYASFIFTEETNDD
ncbi:MAG: AmmeMemoRadiSam system protein B [Methylotenera sp.]|nr:AmmeMemoRadiSam system protein B [Methylotenera sp.]